MNYQKKPIILVCVTKQETSEEIINHGASIRDEVDGDLYLLHVTKKDISNTLTQNIEHFYKLSRRYNANMTVMTSDNVIEIMKQVVKDLGVSIIVMGETKQQHLKKSTLYKLQQSFGNLLTYKIVSIIEENDFQDVI